MSKEKEYYNNTNAEKVKFYGQYFTPDLIAEFMAKWVARNAKSVLDPAAGNNIFFQKVKQINQNCDFTGYEIDPEIAQYFMQNGSYNLLIEDFLLSDWDNAYDAIICNPPYNRFQSIKNRKLVQEKFYNNTGVKYSGYTNQYVLFLIKSIYQMSKTGRLAFIIPSEFLNSKYGDEIKRLLIDDKLLRAIIYFNTNVFENAVTTSCVLLLDKEFKDHVEFITLDDVESISILDVNANNLSKGSLLVDYASLKNNKKWIGFLKTKLPKNYTNCVKLGKFCKVSRGVATGNNDFFLFNKKRIEETMIEKKFFKMCISRSADVKSPIFDTNELSRLVQLNKDVFLLYVNGFKELSKSLQEYIDEGYRNGIHKKYLPSKRNPWYSMENKDACPIWIGSAGRKGIKVVRNLAGIINLTTFHSLNMKEEYADLVDVMFCYLLTPWAQKIISENKKELGNGLDKYQPNDLNDAMVIDLELISNSDVENIKSIYKKMCVVYNEKYVDELNSIIGKYVTAE